MIPPKILSITFPLYFSFVIAGDLSKYPTGIRPGKPTKLQCQMFEEISLGFFFGKYYTVGGRWYVKISLLKLNYCVN